MLSTRKLIQQSFLRNVRRFSGSRTILSQVYDNKMLHTGAHILIKFGGGELDCGTDFPIAIRATFFWGGGGKEPIAQL